MSMFDYVLNVRWRQTLYHLPIAIDLIVKAFLLHRPLTPPIKTLCIFASAATALGAAIIYSVFPSMLLSALALLVAVQSAVTAIILFFEHTLIGRLFMPFTRTNSEVVIM